MVEVKTDTGLSTAPLSMAAHSVAGKLSYTLYFVYKAPMLTTAKKEKSALLYDKYKLAHYHHQCLLQCVQLLEVSE